MFQLTDEMVGPKRVRNMSAVRAGLLLQFFMGLSWAVIKDDLVVKTHLGKIRGFETATADNKKVSAWYGVPYAQPPTGKLRFRHPRPAEPWNDVLDTMNQPNSCVQMPDTMWPGFPGAEGRHTLSA